MSDLEELERARQIDEYNRRVIAEESQRRAAAAASANAHRQQEAVRQLSLHEQQRVWMATGDWFKAGFFGGLGFWLAGLMIWLLPFMVLFFLGLLAGVAGKK